MLNLNLTDKYNLDSLEKDILSYLYNNISNIRNIGIRTVAKDNFTSTATIYKLVKKLGFDGYADMIYSIYYTNEKDSEESDVYSRIENQISPIRTDFINTLNHYKNKQILITGMGFSQIIADYISESLFLKGFKVTSKLHLQLLEKDSLNDILLIVISHSGDTPRLIELTEKALENNIFTISFTGSKNNKLNKLSDLSIEIGNNSKLAINNNLFFGETIIAFELLTATL
ncbi:MAG: MurR/RpiR family transcriptional regulator [Sarcina sp.]